MKFKMTNAVAPDRPLTAYRPCLIDIIGFNLLSLENEDPTLEVKSSDTIDNVRFRFFVF